MRRQLCQSSSRRYNGQSNNLQVVAMGGHDRWHNRDSVTGLRERQQGVGSAAFKRDVRLELSDATGGKGRAYGKAAFEEE